MKTCWMAQGPKIIVVYIYALAGAEGWRDRASRFVDTYLKNPAGIDHELVVVCNGAPANADTHALFAAIPGVRFMNHDDSGWDIGAYQMASRTLACDLMMFCGGWTYFKKPGWLLRAWKVYTEYGYALYGSTGHQGHLQGNIHPHVRTTGFWCHPSLLKEYPFLVTQHGAGGQRYAMEHGSNCLSNWALWQDIPRYIVGWDCVIPLEYCDTIPNGYHHGDQSNVLMGDKMTAPPYYPIM